MGKQIKTQNEIFREVNDRFLVLLEAGIVPWKKEDFEIPANLFTGKQYRGVNVLILTSAGFVRNQFLTYNQVREMEVPLKKGSEGIPIIYWKRYEGETAPANEKMKPLLRDFNVYNVIQCDMPEERVPGFVPKENPLQFCEEILSKMPEKPEIVHRASLPCYLPEFDLVNIPDLKSYRRPEEYYEDLFRQLIHWTGHKKRLNRSELEEFSKDPVKPFSNEELIAEIGVFFLKSIAGIRGGQNDADSHYVMGWIEKLKKDPRMIVYASSKAQKAVDFILNVFQREKKEENQQAGEIATNGGGA